MSEKRKANDEEKEEKKKDNGDGYDLRDYERKVQLNDDMKLSIRNIISFSSSMFFFLIIITHF